MDMAMLRIMIINKQNKLTINICHMLKAPWFTTKTTRRMFAQFRF